MLTSTPDGGSDAAQLELLLRQTLEPATVHVAELRLRKALKPAAAALPLAERAAASEAPEVRQLAAVLLRRRVVDQYSQLGVPERAALKALLLRQLVAETHAPARRALAAVVSTLGASLLPSAEGWAELLQFLSDAAQAAAAEHREVAMLVLAELFESPTSAAIFRPHLSATVGVLRGGLADPHAPQVRTASLRAVGALATSLLDDEDAASIGALKVLFPAALEVARACVQAVAAGGGAARAAGLGEDELSRTLAAAFEMASEVVENGPSALVKANLPAIATVSLELAHAVAADADVRAHGFHCLTVLVSAKPKLLAKNGALVAQLVALGAAAAGEAEEDEEDEEEAAGEEDDERESVRSLGCALLDGLGCALPSKAYLPHVDAALHALTQTADETAWRSACTLLAMVVEGCADALSERQGAERLAGYVQLLCRGCAHPSAHVRSAAALGLGELGRHVPAKDLVPQHAPAIIAHLVAVIDAAQMAGGAGRGEGRALDKVSYALDALCEAAGQHDSLIDVLQPHAHELLARLATLCTAPRASAAARAAAVSALSALVQCGPRLVGAAQLDGLIRTMAALLAATPLLPANASLRARATECIGLCALSLGAERFRPLLAEACAAASAGMGGGQEVAEYTYGFCAHMAALFKGALEPAFVHALLPHMLAACRASDILQSAKQGGGALVSGGGGGDGSSGGGAEEECEDEEDEDGLGLQFNVSSGMIDEKASAVNAIGRLCKHCPHLLGAAAALDCVHALCGRVSCEAEEGADDDDDDNAPTDHFVEGLRIAALANAPFACKAALDTAAASGDAAAVAAANLAVRGVALSKLTKALADEDADVVAAAATALARLGRLAGASVFANLDGKGGSAVLEAVAHNLRLLLTHSAPCQSGFSLGGGIVGGLAAGVGAGSAARGAQPAAAAESDEEEDDDGNLSPDDAVWEAVAALVGGLARTLGDAWAPAVDELLPLLCARAAAGLPMGEQAMAIGVVAEAVERLGHAHAQRLAPQLLPLALRLAATPVPARTGEEGDDDDDDEAAQLVQNAVYCAGVLAAPGGPAVGAHMQQLLTTIHPLLKRSSAMHDRLVDNALGAVARTLRGSHESLPLEQIVAVMLQALPIKEDLRENGVTLRTLVALFSSEQTAHALTTHRATFGRILAEVVSAHDAAVAAKDAEAQIVRDDDDAEDQDEQELPLTPELRAELVAYLAASA